MNKSSMIKGKKLINAIAIIFALAILSPIIGLVQEAFSGFQSNFSSLSFTDFKQIRGTFLLVIFTSLVGGVLGTANGWLLANCRFEGRKFLRYAQLLPLATPAYLLSATLIDFGSIHGIRIYGMQWGVLIMAFTTYPYVFLLSTESFAICGKRQLEACRSLGVGPWKSFFRIALPIAMPAIGAGMALMGMEVINELGAVQLLNIPSISAGILENWVSQGNPGGAIALSFIALIIVMILVAYEKFLRRKSRRWTEGIAGGEAPSWEITGIRKIFAQSIALIPPTFTLGIPILWIITNLEQIQKGLGLDLLQLTLRSIVLGIVSTLFIILIATCMAIAKRWNSSGWMKLLSFLSGIGYAIPGAVLALALLSFGGPQYNLSPLILLLWGYVVRFLAVAKGGLDAAFERINPNIDEAANSLGTQWHNIFRRVHFPLLKGPLVVCSLLVFVDTIKELPLTFILRPFDFDTLSVRIFQYAGDERMGESIIPAIILLLLGLIASISLMPSLEYKDQNNINHKI